MVMGIDQSQESEGKDRTIIALPGVQNDLISHITTCSKGPIIVVILTGGPLDLSTPKNAPRINSILWAGYPGQSGGDAIAQTLFGDNHPAGRLPYTLYAANYISLVSMFDMGMRPNASNGNPGRTYRFYTGTPVYPFGFGLHYTNFTVSINNQGPVKIPYQALNDNLGDDITTSYSSTVFADVTVTVRNDGPNTSDFAALGYVIPPNAGQNGNPIKYLVGFTRFHDIKPGQTMTATFPVTAHDLSLVNGEGKRTAFTGEWVFQIEEEKYSIYVL